MAKTRLLNDYFNKNPLTNCWDWTGGSFSKTGYGYFDETHSKKVLAHRFIWERLNGKISKGKQLDHLCRNRKCVNPAHLEVVSCGENIRRGLLAKLNWDKVKEIRRLYNGGMTQTAIAKVYEITQPHVSDIVNRERWVN